MSETHLEYCERCQKVTAWTVYYPKKKDIRRHVCNECGNEKLKRSNTKEV